RGVPMRPADTPREWLAEVRTREALVPAHAAIAEFVECYEALRFGAHGDPRELAESLARIERTLR
ncbi:MAG TPA: DUF4129 domain-containing protein, partial [Oscillatoriaceae cyanobacterium]